MYMYISNCHKTKKVKKKSSFYFILAFVSLLRNDKRFITFMAKWNFNAYICICIIDIHDLEKTNKTEINSQQNIYKLQVQGNGHLAIYKYVRAYANV